MFRDDYTIQLLITGSLLFYPFSFNKFEKWLTETKLSFDQRKFILQFYWKFENMVKWRDCLRGTMTRIRRKFETDGTVQYVHKQHSGRLHHQQALQMKTGW